MEKWLVCFMSVVMFVLVSFPVHLFWRKNQGQEPSAQMTENDTRDRKIRKRGETAGVEEPSF